MDEELEKKQIKNGRNKVRGIVNKADDEVIFKLIILLGFDVPFNLKDKYNRDRIKE